MKRILGVMLACLVLVLLVGTSSRADFRVETLVDDYSIVAADNGSFSTNNSFDVLVYNNTGAVLEAGTVVVLDTAACPVVTKPCVKAAPAAEKEKVIGVINIGSEAGLAHMAVAGFFSIRVTGAVTAGDLLRVSSTVAGEAETAPGGEKGVFAVALSGGTGGLLTATFTKQEVF